jgi:hypothetical protein
VNIKRGLCALAIFSFSGLAGALCLVGATIAPPETFLEWAMVFYFGMMGLSFFLGGIYVSYKVFIGEGDTI